MNPCKWKGRDGARGTTGKTLSARPGLLEERKGCECRFALLPAAPDSRDDASYLMRIERGRTSFPKCPAGKALKKHEKWAVPCAEIFRHKTSPGTAAYRRTQERKPGEKKKKKFLGCQEVEEFLVTEKLVLHRMKEEGANPAAFGYGPVVSERRALDTVEFANAGLKAKQNFLDGYLEEGNSNFASAAPVEAGPRTSLSGVFGLRPSDIRESTMRYLYESGAFRRDHMLEMTAQIILDIGEMETALIRRQFPAYPLEEFAVHQSRLYAYLAKRQNPALKKFEGFWLNLTRAQRTALELVYMREETLSVAAAAKQLRISADSLRDRLRGALNKLRAHYPEFSRLKRRKNRKAPATDLAYYGFFRKSLARTRAPVFQIDPASGARREISS